MTEQRIALATADQLEAILEIHRITQAEHHARLPNRFPEGPSASEEILKYYFGKIAPPPAIRLISAVVNGRLAGYVFFWLQPKAFGDDRHNLIGTIVDISLHPEFRNQGLGKMLLQAAEVEMHAQGGTSMEAQVWRGNDASFALFQTSGFAPEMTTFNKYLGEPIAGKVPVTAKAASSTKRARLEQFLRYAIYYAAIFVILAWVVTH